MAKTKPKQAVQQVVAIAEHTPGPWHWDLRPGMRSVSLMGRGLIVMDFVRWGMDNAAPRFRTERCLMVRVEELGAPIPGREHHEWAKQIIHPDARLMADAPAMSLCLELFALGLARFEPATQAFCFDGLAYFCGTDWGKVLDVIGWDVARAAIAKATGKAAAK